MNLREIINEYRSKLVDAKDLAPVDAAQMLVELTALTGNIHEEIVGRGNQYRIKLADLVEKYGSVAKAKVIAQASPEYGDLVQATAYLEMASEMIRSLKVFIKSKEEERRFSSNV